MELAPPPDLLWMPEMPERCFFTGDPLFMYEVLLRFEGPGRPAILQLELARAESGGPWYGYLEDLEEALAELDWQPSDLKGFRLGPDGLKAGVCLSVQRGVESLEAYFERRRRQIAAMEAPPPSAEEVAALPALRTTWEVVVRPAGYLRGESGQTEVMFLVLVVDERGPVRSSGVHSGAPPDVAALRALILKATRGDDEFGYPAGRPALVRLTDAPLAAALAEALDDLGIAITAGPTPHADEAINAFVEARGPAIPAFFSAYGLPQLQAYFTAARAFFRARPWDRFAPNKYLGFRIDDGPWTYANVMGQMGEEFGLALFDDWLSLCRFVHERPAFAAFLGGNEGGRLEAAGATESVSLAEIQALHPEDALHLQAHGLKPDRQGRYPTILRITPQGFEPPRLPLDVYTALLNALTQVLTKRTAPQITSVKQRITTGRVAIDLRYPARGDEREELSATAYEFVVHGTDGELYYEWLPRGRRCIVRAPGDVRLADVAFALRRASDVFRIAFGAGGDILWADDGNRKDPSPYVSDLPSLAALWLDVNGTRYDAVIRALPTGHVREIEIERT